MNRAPSQPKYFLIFQKDKIILSDDYQPLTNITFLKTDLNFYHDIGHFHDVSVSTAEWHGNNLPEGFSTLTIKRTFEKLSLEWYQLIAKALSIINWDKNNQFCGHCGVATIKTEGIFEKSCPSCLLLFYPRISPSVIVLIEKGDELLMARGIHFRPGAYGLIAGFVDPGETFEEAVHREVMEEVGITIKNLHYFGSQSWPFPDSLIAAFRAEYDAGELIIDHKELEKAGWYHYDNLPGLPSSSISIARKLIDAFLAEKLHKS